MKLDCFPDSESNNRSPHAGEWKHWSSGAGDVHKVVSEILMASQIAKEITGMVNACLVNVELGSSDEEKVARKSNKSNNIKLKAQGSSSHNRGPLISSSSKRIVKKQDPMHKFRVMTPSESSKRHYSSTGASTNSSRKEVLYPKSKPTAADLIRRPSSAAHMAQEISSTERKMQSRRSPRGVTSPRTSVEEPSGNSKSRTVVAPPESKSATARTSSSAECSSSLAVVKNQKRDVVLTGENSRAAPSSQRRNQVRLAEGSSMAAPTPRTSVEGSLSGANVLVTREHNATIESARLSSEEPLLRRGTNVSVAQSCEPSGISSAVMHASADDLVWSKIRAKFTAAAPPESHRHESSSSAQDQSSTRIRTDFNSSAAELASRNRVVKAAPAEATRVAETSCSSRENNVGRATANPVPVLAKIRTRVAAATSEPSAAASVTPKADPVKEDPVLARIRARVSAAAEPLAKNSVRENEPQAKLQSRATAGTPRKYSATTSDTWEAKEITNCYNSPRAGVGEYLSKKHVSPAAGAIPSTSAAAVLKRVRSSRSPPQASHQMSAVQPRLSTSAAVQSSSTNTFWRDTFSKIHIQQQLSPSAATAGLTPLAEALPPEKSLKFLKSPLRSQTGAAKMSSSAPGVKIPHPQGVPTTVAANFEINEDNGSVPSKGSFRSGRNDDWFKKSLEATEISLGASSKMWGKSGVNNKAVLFSNPTFAPASPPGSRPSPGKERSPTPPPGASSSTTDPRVVKPESPKRSTSATRRMREWVGNILPKRRSVSPNVGGGRFISPGRTSLPSLISRLPSRGRKSCSSAPRSSVYPFSSSRKEVAPAIELPLPPCRQAQQLTASKLAELPARPEAMELKAHKERMDRQAHGHHMAAQKFMMVQNWNQTVEPPTPFDKDVTLAEQTPAPFLYSKRQLNEMGCGYDDGRKHSDDSECNPNIGTIPNVKYSWEMKERDGLAVDKPEEIVDFMQELTFEKGEREAPRVLSRCSSMRQRQGQGTVAAGWNAAGKENIGPAAMRVGGNSALRKSCSVNSQRSTSTVRAMSTGKIRPGPSFLKRAKEWMRTQTPFRDRPQKTTAS
ncbi:hypothetical protein R1sor_001909 [Riccia sorocarpa]|uniref:Uncharacterized protein n=1 Tax=Riccia sorocarpa TaxID=122646 RepID=A0ABD3H0D8_9MARC